MTASKRRIAVTEARMTARISERRACRFTGFSISSQRYRTQRPSHEGVEVLHLVHVERTAKLPLGDVADCVRVGCIAGPAQHEQGDDANAQGAEDADPHAGDDEWGERDADADQCAE